MTRIALIALSIACLAAVSGCSGSDQEIPGHWTVSGQLSVERLSPGIWVHTSRQILSSGESFPGNGLLVKDGDGLILIDTAWGAELTSQLLDWIDTELEQPVTQAIITHFHADSMGGAGVLHERGIPYRAHPMTLALGAGTGLPLPEPIDELQHGESVLIGNVEVFYPGPGHSRDNLVVWVPGAKVIFGSCAVRSPEFEGRGNTADADVAHWPRAIQRVLERYPDVQTVVPGHGEPGGVELLTHTIGLFSPE